MTTDAFPDDPSGRRAIVVLEQHEIENCSRKGETQILTDSQTHVVAYPIADKYVGQALTNIRDAGLDRPGTVLIQSPFDLDYYEDATEASQQFALRKHVLLSNLCRLLGATKVSVTQIDIATSKNGTDFKLEGRVGVNTAAGSLENTTNDSLCSQLTLVDEYPGGEPDVEAAEKLLRSSRLLGDPNMRSLILSREGEVNRLTRRTLTVNLSTEANKNLRIVGRFGTLPAAFDAEYSKAVTEIKEYRLTVEVLFPEV